MNDALQPWHRQFWPWFIIALLGSTIVASLVTVWIAVAAAPNRVDGAGLMAVPVGLSADKTILVFDLGLPPPDAAWPHELRVSLDSRSNGEQQNMRAQRIDERSFEAPVATLQPGIYDVTLEAAGSNLALQGSWSYPAPVWKLAPDERAQ
ncbi:MAG: FixH family protein [Gammaproteobacteria bacterium]|nr:FixH family protein [Gammaproteobacteria bacterium]NNF62128.1 hypothetical protein [Gammaproteobacteria bacterium]